MAVDTTARCTCWFVRRGMVRGRLDCRCSIAMEISSTTCQETSPGVPRRTTSRMQSGMVGISRGAQSVVVPMVVSAHFRWRCSEVATQLRARATDAPVASPRWPGDTLALVRGRAPWRRLAGAQSHSTAGMEVTAGAWAIGVLVAGWLAIEILPSSYWRARNVRERIRYRRARGEWCGHRPDPEDPPHWERPYPGTAWSEWRPRSRGGRVQTCRTCGVERRVSTRKQRKQCFHHDRPAWAKGEIDSVSYIREELIDMGKRKRYECVPAEGGCGRMWFT